MMKETLLLIGFNFEYNSPRMKIQQIINYVVKIRTKIMEINLNKNFQRWHHYICKLMGTFLNCKEFIDI